MPTEVWRKAMAGRGVEADALDGSTLSDAYMGSGGSANGS
jgi:hypothetical protein